MQNYKFSEWEERILQLAMQGKTLEEIAREVGLSPTRLRARLSKELYFRLGLKGSAALTGAVGQYAYQLGFQGKPYPGTTRGMNAAPWQNFRLGKLDLPTIVVSSSLTLPPDVECIISNAKYQPPMGMNSNLQQWREEAVARAAARNEIMYERGQNMLVVNRIEADNEFYKPVRLTLQTTGYITDKAIKQNLPADWRVRYPFNPSSLTDAKLPHPIAADLHVLVGSPLQLLVLKRAENLGMYPGVYAFAVAGLGEADNDVTTVPREAHFDFVRTMLRELHEERMPEGAGISAAWFRENIRLLALLFDINLLGYDITGYIVIRHRNATTLRDSIANAKEGVYELLDFPDPDYFDTATHKFSTQRDAEALKRLCHHILHEPWDPDSVVSLVILLTRLFGADVVYPLLGAPLE